ncbi:hypothetical protein QR680_001254 [Steinernema hermaphroditum]|uniref:BHLH domain-containing protein n=1 Tax=Steinernema hermaphroditum TaxID=289476 RepID=A0AA39LFI7_9BILA|nr:hypothetical protein QR680_001254 [Steinernema hermaphroditum]
MNYPAASYILSTYRNTSFSALTVAGLFPSLEAGVANHVDNSGKSSVNPFSPEAKVPLPREIEELGNPIGKRNRRERDRVRCVNEGYEILRSALPLQEHERRISKVDTLRLAIFYIKHLDSMLKHENHQSNCTCFDKFVAESTEHILRGKLQRSSRKRTAVD